MQIGLWKRFKPEVLLQAIQGINKREDCSDFNLVGLLGVMHRYADSESFPEDTRRPSATASSTSSTGTTTRADAMCYRTENHSILFHTCEVLAGQLYPTKRSPTPARRGPGT
jgi:hypothetical protein